MRLLQALLSTTLPLLPDGRVQLLPDAPFAARDGRPGAGRKWQVPAGRGAAIAQEMNRVAGLTAIVVDYEHQTLHKERNGQPAPAAGWIRGGVEWLAGKGLVAPVDWTPRAKAAIEGGEYAYLSPVIQFDEATLEVRGVALAALTNYPAIVGMDAVVATLNTDFTHEEPDMALLAALLTAIGLPADTTEAAALQHVTTLKTKAEAAPPKAALTTAVVAALGLAEGADEAAALSAITTLKAAGTGTDATTLATMQAMQVQIAQLTAQAGEDKVIKLVDQALAEHKLIPAQKQWALDLGKKDFAALTSYIASAPAIPGLGGQSGGIEPGAGAAALSADADKLRAGFGLSPEAWTKAAPQKTTA